MAKGLVAVGEVGLLGEIRKVGMMKRRQTEVKKLGFTQMVSPDSIKTLREYPHLQLYENLLFLYSILSSIQKNHLLINVSDNKT